MNTTLASARSLDRDDRHAHTDTRFARISPVDRLSLRLGLWLLLRSTRRLRALAHTRALALATHEASRASQRARDARDATALAHLRAHHRA